MTLAEYLKLENVKPSHFATRLGVSASTVSRFLKGERVPSPQMLRRIAELTSNRVTPNDFMGISPAPSIAREDE